MQIVFVFALSFGNALNTVEKYKAEKLKNFQELQAKSIWPKFNSEPAKVGKLETRGILNNAHVSVGPYGGLTYQSPVSGCHYPVKKGMRVQLNP